MIKILTIISIVIMPFIQIKNKTSVKIIPEWTTPKGVALVYPEKLPDNRDKLIKFYDSFIQTILDSSDLSEVTILHRPGLKEMLTKKFQSDRINLIEISYVQDIWIRDWAPLATTTDKVIKAYYSPQYFAQHNKQYAHQDDKAGIEITKILKINVTNLTCLNQRLILDGGNFIHNGNGIGITTNRIIADNESLSIDEIRKTFSKQLGISKLIIVPVEPGDETGHVDGMLRFIDEKTVVVATYPDDYQEGKEFLNNLANQLQKDFQVIRITNETPKDQKPDEFPSAYGNYINYLRIGNKIFLPQYGIDKDTNARQEYEKYFTVIPVDQNINKLAKLGGVLNCITWTYY